MRVTVLVLLASMWVVSSFAQGPDQLPPQQTVEVHGAKIRYYDMGEKTSPVVLLLHGLGDRAANHLDIARALAQHFRVIAPDQIGHGASDKPGLSYRVRTFSDFNKGLLDALGIGHASVVGESLGGWVAADMVLRFPGMFDRLVLVDSAGVKSADHPFSEKDIPAELYVTSIFDQRKILERIFFHKEWVTDRMVEDAFREHLKSGDAPVISSFLSGLSSSDEWLNDRSAGIKAPTLILWCKHDELLSPSGADVLQGKITASKKVMLDDCGHVPAENWQAYNSALMGFLLAK